MDLVARMDDYGKLAWLAVMVLGFIVFWPIGLAILAYLIWSGRMGWTRRMACWKEGRFHGREGWSEGWRRHGRTARHSGNSAFDEYREETLRRLEEEQDEFREFLDRLRRAKDKAEFDEFMAERRHRPRPGPDAPGGPIPEPQG